ncbi:MAG: CvpA family protein [Candidatus Brocadiae bacterium]|nr:CvpA family protein [Candidatus Brocadiia bacterium]
MFVLAAAGEGWKLGGVLSPVDIGVILVLLVSFGIGYWTGFVWQVIRIVSLVASVWISVVYSPVVAESLRGPLGPPLARVAAALGVFLAALMLFYLVGFLCRKLINAIKLDRPDRIMGALFGLAKGALLIGVIAFIILRYVDEDRAVYKHTAQSVVATFTARCVGGILQVLPGVAREKIGGG